MVYVCFDFEHRFINVAVKEKHQVRFENHINFNRDEFDITLDLMLKMIRHYRPIAVIVAIPYDINGSETSTTELAAALFQLMTDILQYSNIKVINQNYFVTDYEKNDSKLRVQRILQEYISQVQN